VATNFPASLDSLTNPTSSDSLNSPSHSAQHANSNDAIEALQAKVGVDSSAVTSSLDYKVAQLEAGATGGKILQVVSTTKTDPFTTTSTSFTDVTGLSVSITPTSATSKIFVLYDLNWSADGVGYNLTLRIMRDSTEIGSGTPAGVRKTANKSSRLATNYWGTMTGGYLDSPATTAATTYKIQVVQRGGTASINQHSLNVDDTLPDSARTASTITVFEVSA